VHQDVRPPQAMRPGQRILRSGTEGGQYFPKVTANRSVPEFADYLFASCDPPSPSRYHPFGAGQSEFAYLQGWSHALARRRVADCGTDSLCTTRPSTVVWLNQAEIAISLFSGQCLARRRIRDRATLRKETRAWSRRMNRHGVPSNGHLLEKELKSRSRY